MNDLETFKELNSIGFVVCSLFRLLTVFEGLTNLEITKVSSQFAQIYDHRVPRIIQSKQLDDWSLTPWGKRFQKTVSILGLPHRKIYTVTKV